MMKQNNTHVLFKSLALCFLILGNLTFEVVCTASAPVTVAGGNIKVPIAEVFKAINNHYKSMKDMGFFQFLVDNSSNLQKYDFEYDSFKNGVEILKEKISKVEIPKNPEEKQIAAIEFFKSFTSEVKKFKNDFSPFKKQAKVSAADLQTFMKNFKFENNKFVLNTDPESGISLDGIAGNLDVTMKCDLESIQTSLKDFKFDVSLDPPYDLFKSIKKESVFSDAKEYFNTSNLAGLIGNYKNTKNALDGANSSAEDFQNVKKASKKATNELNKAIVSILERQVKKKVLNLPLSPSSKSLTFNLKTVLDTFNRCVASITLSRNLDKVKIVLKCLNRGCEEYFKVNRVDTFSNFLSITSTDIGIDKIVDVPNFINTQNELSKDVFLAIAETCTANDANACFGSILSKLKSNYDETISNALSKFNKSVTKDEFNEAFSPFATEILIDGQQEDVGMMSRYVNIEGNNCEINLYWLLNFTNGIEQFNHYMSWLEISGYLQSPPKRVRCKADAMEEFFKLIKDKLSEYKVELGTVATSADSLDMI